MLVMKIKQIDVDNMTFSGFTTVEQPDGDSDKEIIDIDSLDIQYYMRSNPLVLYNHRNMESEQQLPIGKTISIEKRLTPEGYKALYQTIQLADIDGYELPGQVFALIQLKALNTFSNGYYANDDTRSETDDTTLTRIFNLVLMETSVVMFPANTSAIISRSMDVEMEKNVARTKILLEMVKASV